MDGFSRLYRAEEARRKAKSLVMIRTREEDFEGRDERDGRQGREIKKHCWQTYHGVYVANHLVWGDLTVLFQELPRRGDISLDVFNVAGHLVARIIFDLYVVVL